MKKYFFLCTLLIMSFCTKSEVLEFNSPKQPEVYYSYSSLGGDSLRVVSYNLLFEKTVPSQSAQQWVNRITTVKKYFTEMHFDIIGTQEALTFQVNDLLKALPDFDKVGLDLGGNANDAKAENAALFYNKNKLEVVKKGDFWFSLTPDVPGSYSWNSGYPRKCTWAQFKVKATGTEFYVFNSHFYVFEDTHEAKKQCAIILKEKIVEIAGDAPVICTGDLNATPTSPVLGDLLKDNFLHDSRVLSPKTSGAVGTYHGFASQASSRLDYVLVDDKAGVFNYRAINDELYNGKYGSDHLPVVVDVVIKK